MDQKFASLKLAVKHNELKLVKDIIATERTIQGLVVNFDFRTPEWAELTKTASFIRDGKSYLVLLDAVDDCFIPWECLESKGTFTVGVFGVADGVRLTTNVLRFSVAESCTCEGEEPSEPTPEIYEQILALCGDAHRVAQSVRNDVDAGKLNGKDGEPGKDGRDGEPGQPGRDGSDGKDGLTPYIAANGNWWIGTTDTGVKAKGTDGVDGVSVTHSWDGNNLTITSASGTSVIDLSHAGGGSGSDGLTPHIAENGNWWIGTTDTGVKAAGIDGKDGINGVDGKDGADGKDGISCAHSWDGTILTITSASGTSAVDLKGEPGKDGTDGYIPIRGTDYWTEEDKVEIKSYVDIQLGDISTALDVILEIQETIVGGVN